MRNSFSFFGGSRNKLSAESELPVDDSRYSPAVISMNESEPDLDRFLTPRLRVMRIILLALVLGCVMFLIIAVAIRLSENVQNDTAPLLTYMGVGFGLVAFALHLIIPRATVATARKQIAGGTWPSDAAAARYPGAAEKLSGMSDVGKLCSLYQSQLIIGAALLEGATFFNLVAYLQEGDPTSLVASALLLGAMLRLFPTRGGVENFLVEQGELLRQERLIG
jgi:hypothetical protein